MILLSCSGCCRKDCITPNASTHRSSEAAAPLKLKHSHRLKRNSYTVRAKFAKRSIYKNFEELPLFLNAEIVAKTLGVSPSTAYELMHEKGFPSLRIGSRIVVPKEKFQQWVEEQMRGAK